MSRLATHLHRLSIAVALVLAPLLGCESSTPPYAVADIPFPEGWVYAPDDAPVLAEHGMVVSTDEYASRVGTRILQAGGNAVDAAIATSFALAVVNPEAGNIGGGGFMVIRLTDGTTASLDYRERAPLAATRDMFLNESGELREGYTEGHLAAGVPGTVAGMWAAHQRFGTLPWAELVAPAVELAQTFDADLLLVHVTQPLQTVSGATTMAGYHLPTVEKEINAEVSQRADELIEKEIPASLRSEARILRGNPASEIADLAEKENADLIVIASKGDAAWKQALFGSVAEGVVRHAACPVMAVPAS